MLLTYFLFFALCVGSVFAICRGEGRVVVDIPAQAVNNGRNGLFRWMGMKRWQLFRGNTYTRAVMAILLVLSGYLLLSSYFFHNHTRAMSQFRHEELQRLVSMGVNVIAPLREQYQAGEISREAALAESASLLRHMTYDYGHGDNYLFMTSYTGTMLVQPFQPELEGTSQWYLQDVNGVYIIQTLVKKAQQGSGFVEYYYPPPNSSIPEKKITYVVGIPEWEVYIGTGMYMTAVEAQNSAYFTNSLISALALFSVIVSIIFFTLRPVASSYRTLVQLFDQVRASPDQMPVVPANDFRPGSEEWRLMTGFAAMLHQLQQHKEQLQAALIALQNSEARFRAVFEGAAVGISVRDTEGKLLESNNALQQMVGYSHAEWASLSYADYTHPEDISNADQLFFATARGEREGFQIEKRFLRKDRRPLWGRITASLVRDPQGQPQYVISMLEDVTERIEAYQLMGQRVEERTHQLTTLLEMTQQVNATLELEPLLKVILDQIKKVVDYSGAGIFTMQGADELRLIMYQGPIPQEKLRFNWKLSEDVVNAKVVQSSLPVIIPDVTGDTPLALAYQASAGDHLIGTTRGWMGIPLIVRDRVIGMLSFDHTEPNYYTGHHARLAFAFANQAANAIENAHLYEEAKQLAVLRERQRLARELHDAVTQTLFSANLIAEVLPRVWQKNPEEGMRRLAQIHQLTRGALAEMRTLLFELRPGALTDVPLSDLLRQLADAISGRTGIEVNLSIKGVIQMPPQVKIAFYRVAQEALNNVIKHAEASRVQVTLVADPHQARLTIQDNGTGFDPATVPPDHFGVAIMAERAREICAEWELTSEPGLGTSIILAWTEKEGVLADG